MRLGNFDRTCRLSLDTRIITSVPVALGLNTKYGQGAEAVAVEGVDYSATGQGS